MKDEWTRGIGVGTLAGCGDHGAGSPRVDPTLAHSLPWGFLCLDSQLSPLASTADPGEQVRGAASSAPAGKPKPA